MHTARAARVRQASRPDQSASCPCVDCHGMPLDTGCNVQAGSTVNCRNGEETEEQFPRMDQHTDPTEKNPRKDDRFRVLSEPSFSSSERCISPPDSIRIPTSPKSRPQRRKVPPRCLSEEGPWRRSESMCRLLSRIYDSDESGWSSDEESAMTSRESMMTSREETRSPLEEPDSVPPTSGSPLRQVPDGTPSPAGGRRRSNTGGSSPAKPHFKRTLPAVSSFLSR